MSSFPWSPVNGQCLPTNNHQGYLSTVNRLKVSKFFLNNFDFHDDLMMMLIEKILNFRNVVIYICICKNKEHDKVL